MNIQTTDVATIQVRLKQLDNSVLAKYAGEIFDVVGIQPNYQMPIMIRKPDTGSLFMAKVEELETP